MSKIVVAVSIVAASLLLSSLPTTGGQEQDGRLTQRVAELEDKVARIEQLLLVKSLLPTNGLATAEVRLVAAEERLRYAQRLFDKGFSTQIQLDTKKLLVVMARKQLELAKGAKTDVGKVLEIDVLEAEQYLSVSRQRLEYSQRMATKGYVTALQVQSDKFTVEKARSDRDRTQAKLEAHNQTLGQALPEK